MLRALLLAVLVAAPAGLAAVPPAAPEPRPGHPVGPEFFVRQDPDGNRTLLLGLEDDPAGPYVYRRLAGFSGELREVGTYLHPWTWNGLPEVTLGAYAVSASQRTVRTPLVLLENAASDGALSAAMLDALLRYDAGSAQALVPFLEEAAFPELTDPSPAGLRFEDFQDFPPVVAWHARRALPGAELWLGSYVDRDGSVGPVPGGQEGVRSAELGLVARAPSGQDVRLAGVYVEQRARALDDGAQRTLASSVTVGARSASGRVPLATLEGEDARSGLAVRPDAQRSTFTLGLEGPGGFVPLAGVRSDAAYRYHAQGVEVTRLTALGAFVAGAWTPLAGLHYHADRAPLLGVANGFLGGGTLGSSATGDAELGAGAFVGDAYQPLAEVSLDDAFAGASLPHQTMVTLSTFSPLGPHHLASATYEGTDSLRDWAFRLAQSKEKDSGWLMSAGPWAGALYAPLVGVRFRGDAPGAEQAQEAEVAAGTFALGYPNFVPLAAASASSDEPYAAALTRVATQGPGSPAGHFQAEAGSYALGDYAPLAQVRYDPVSDPAWPASSDTTLLLAGQPALGVQYRGQAPLLQSWGAATSLSDDKPWRAAIGAYGPGGFTPLVRVSHDGSGTTVLVGPDL